MLIDEVNSIIDQASAPLSVFRPKPLWSEQDPQDWWKATNEAVSQLDPANRRKVKSIGLSGQMHGATLLDRSDTPIRPAILWNDGRSSAQCEQLKRNCPDIEHITGNLVMPGFTAPKLLWLKEFEPDNFNKVTSILLPKDYVRLLMTGEKASDMSDSSGTSWLNVAERRWSSDALSACDLDQSAMPGLYEGPETTGRLRAKLADEWGMNLADVVAGGGDNAAGAAGVGVIDDGEALLSLGTSGVIFVAGNEFRPQQARAVHAFCHALPGLWHQMTVILSAASCVDWAVAVSQSGSAAELIALAETRNLLNGKELFLPYLSGERTPHNNPHARGVLFGLDHDSDRAAIGQAVLEGITFAFADGLDAILETGTNVTSLSVIGGGSRSRYWGRILAAALGRPMIFRSGAEYGPAFGAAKLARLGHTGGDPRDILAAPPVIDMIEPNENDVVALSDKRHKFSNLYNALKPEFEG